MKLLHFLAKRKNSLEKTSKASYQTHLVLGDSKYPNIYEISEILKKLTLT